jgi:hypothetical protein
MCTHPSQKILSHDLASEECRQSLTRVYGKWDENPASDLCFVYKDLDIEKEPESDEEVKEPGNGHTKEK